MRNKGACRWRGKGPTRLAIRVPIHIALLASLFVAATSHASRAEDRNTLEYAVKATFVYKFAPFVTWPGAAPGNGAFPICVSGSDHVSPLIAVAVRGQEIDGHPITVRQVTSAEGIEGCSILYVATSNLQDARALLSAARGKPVLTITDGGDSVHGIIAFHVMDGHVRFDIDEDLATESKLTISSKLLQLANTVTPRPQP